MDPGIHGRVRAALRDRDATAALARFTARELAVAYTARGKAYILRELIQMLFDATSDANRSQAAAFLAPVLHPPAR